VENLVHGHLLTLEVMGITHGFSTDHQFLSLLS
jgi:hypothetical protein